MYQVRVLQQSGVETYELEKKQIRSHSKANMYLEHSNSKYALGRLKLEPRTANIPSQFQQRILLYHLLMTHRKLLF